MCIKGSLSPCPLFVHGPYRRSPSPKFRGSSSFPICWVKSGLPCRRPGPAASLEPAFIYGRAVLPSCLASHWLQQIDRWTDGWTCGLQGVFSSFLPFALCHGLTDLVPSWPGQPYVPAVSLNIQSVFEGQSGPAGQHVHPRSLPCSCTSIGAQLTPGISMAESFPRERHLTGAIFMGHNKDYRWKNSLLVGRPFHLIVSSDLRDHQESPG